MNYLSIYNKIIDRAILEGRKKSNSQHVYYEKHHILPKCLGGSDDASNLVLLTAREHFICHQLLTKIYPKNIKLIFSLRMMTASNKRQIRNNREYEWIRRKISNSSSESQKGKSYGYKFPKGHKFSEGPKNGMYNKKHTDSSRVLMSKKAKNRDASSYDHLRYPKPESTKEKIRKTKQKNKFLLTGLNNQEYIVDRISEASKISGVSCSVLVKLAGNRYGFDHCRGWKIYKINP